MSKFDFENDFDFDNKENIIEELPLCPKCGEHLEYSKLKQYLYECSNPHCDYKEEQYEMAESPFFEILIKSF